MDYLPVFTKLAARPCLVVGGGSVALRKVQLLLKAGAQVSLCAPQIDARLFNKADKKQLKIIEQLFSPELLAGQWLVIAATNDHRVNQQVAEAATAMQLLVNVVDDPALSTFIMPSIVDRSPIIVAISSAGKAPVLTRLLRERLEAMLPMHLGSLAKISGKFRSRVKTAITNVSLRRRYWEKLFTNGALESLLAEGETEKALGLMEDSLKTDIKSGNIAIVGVGPGDPSLLTLKALQLMQQADFVLYQQSVSPGILDLVRRDAELTPTGKDKEHCKILVDYARQGKRVVYLLAGDAHTFSQDKAIAQQLVKSQIPLQLIPGISTGSY
jgi:uroporphyrin-III C-methyltransferase/precorrin-2 dehydrogenase/sirohydrochlorin ferrochelatase